MIFANVIVQVVQQRIRIRKNERVLASFIHDDMCVNVKMLNSNSSPGLVYEQHQCYVILGDIGTVVGPRVCRLEPGEWAQMG